MDDATNTQLQDNMFNEEHGAIDQIYIDMEMFQDFKFGALLTTVSVAEEIKYIYENIKAYNARVDFEICKYFPALNRTEEDISAILKDPNMRYKLAGLSPFTEAYDIFVQLLQVMVQHNKAVSTGKAPVLNINVVDIAYPEDILDIFASNLQKIIPSLAVNVSRYPRYTLPMEEFISNNVFFILEMFNLVKDFSTSSVEFVQHGSFFGKRIFSPCYIDTTLHKDPRDYDKILVSTEYGLGIYCDFKYIPISLMMEGSDG